jgi:hypothetical protein
MEYESAYGPGASSPTPAPEPRSLWGRCKKWTDKALDEWRLITVASLLLALCLLVGDIGVNVHWKLLQDFQQPITYSMIKDKCVFYAT